MNANVNQAEIDKFSKLASGWWDIDGDMKPLHQMNPLRLDYILNKTSLENKTVLDLGCGGGILSEALAKAGASVTGIDMSTEAINVARDHATQSDLTINYEITPVENVIDKYKNHFDVITCMEMLEHVPDPKSIIKTCSQLIKPDGHLFFSTINRNPKSYLLAILAAEYILRLLPKGTHDYESFIRPSELDKWTRSCDLDRHDLTGMLYNPLTKEFKLGEDVSVNYFFYCRPKS